jgi:hypothetical protein
MSTCVEAARWMGMLTDGPKYKRPTVDGYYGLTNLSRIGVGYYVAKY